MLGADQTPYLLPGDWQIGGTYRTFRADKQYKGNQLSQPINRLRNQVISELQTLDLFATYAQSRQWNLSVNIPVVLYGSSSRGLPALAGPDSPRFVQSTKGLGDITLSARRWLLDTRRNPGGNLALGVGVKLPTGDANARDRFPNARGVDERLRPVDPSIQLGDGGLGVQLQLEGFKQVGSATVVLTGAYLMTPRGQTHTLSPRSFLAPGGPAAIEEFERYNTVADQYVGRLGVIHPVPGVKGLAVLLAGRAEGVPVHDAVGKTIGFRRPGYTVAIEPGLVYSYQNTALSITVPVVMDRNILDQRPGTPRESTFADYSIIVTVTHRIGKSGRAARPLRADAGGAQDRRCPECGMTHTPVAVALAREARRGR